MSEAYFTTDDQKLIKEFLGYPVYEGYSTLLGPDRFCCVLTEPEDRNWLRDGADVIDLLNAQHRKILKLEQEADAYIAMLDEQEALQVPYDFEWLAARPEFEKEQDMLLAETGAGAYIVYRSDGWRIGKGLVWYDIPAPATKADVIKLLEVFT